MESNRMELGLPEKLEMQRHPSGIEITRRWFTWGTIFLTGFAIVWDGFLLMWYSIALAGHANLLFVLFPLIHVGAGICITYSALTGWVNSTRIRVEQGQITVRHGPLPWYGNKSLDGSTLKQLYSKEKVSTGRNSTTVTFDVHAITSDSRDVKLVSGLESSEQALYIEQEIERHFHIENAPVRGEIAA